MANSTGVVHCICPFFRYESNNMIGCEGMMPRSRLRNYFANPEDKEKYMERVCCTYEYDRRCLIAAALSAKYKKSCKDEKSGG